MAFERNDIVNKTRLMGELGEELMGFEHNDIVTVDVMNKAIEEGGGGGGGGYATAKLTVKAGETGLAAIMFKGLVCLINGVFSGDALYIFDTPLNPGESTDIDVILYNGSSSEFSPDLADLTDLTGDITENSGKYIMTGNATVTYTPLE